MSPYSARKSLTGGKYRDPKCKTAEEKGRLSQAEIDRMVQEADAWPVLESCFCFLSVSVPSSYS